MGRNEQVKPVDHKEVLDLVCAVIDSYKEKFLEVIKDSDEPMDLDPVKLLNTYSAGVSEPDIIATTLKLAILKHPEEKRLSKHMEDLGRSALTDALNDKDIPESTKTEIRAVLKAMGERNV